MWWGRKKTSREFKKKLVILIITKNKPETPE